jgi:predicted nucleic acid-binding protein
VFVEEPGADEVLQLWTEADRVVCIAVGYLEVRSAIARRLGSGAAAAARAELDDYWIHVEVVDVDDRLIALAAASADVHALRAFDSLHLAAALDLRDSELLLASWDGELRRAAEAEGIAVAPPG